MQLQTKYLGKVHIDPSTEIYFSAGLPGFEEEKTFVLLDMSHVDSVIFQTLQSTTTPSLAFIVVSPYMLTKEFEFELDDGTVEGLQIENKEDVLVCTIITVHNPFNQSTLNLKAPILINTQKRIGKQYIISTDTYATKTPLASFVDSGSKENS